MEQYFTLGREARKDLVQIGLTWQSTPDTRRYSFQYIYIYIAHKIQNIEWLCGLRLDLNLAKQDDDYVIYVYVVHAKVSNNSVCKGMVSETSVFLSAIDKDKLSKLFFFLVFFVLYNCPQRSCLYIIHISFDIMIPSCHVFGVTISQQQFTFIPRFIYITLLFK